ncbi:MAG: hypothetical protein QNK37_17655 [Acidobacteriota bacterium]|nr:hypothetical protein [Acidobacteriota bacterium]
MLLSIWIALIISKTADQPVWQIDLADLDIYGHCPVAVVSSDLLVVGDEDNGQLVFMDAAGRELKRAGSKGQGPGEMSNLGMIQWCPHQQILTVTDYANRRFSRWDKDGKLLAEHPFPNDRLHFFHFVDDHRALALINWSGHMPGEVCLILFDMKTRQRKMLFQHKQDAPKKLAQFQSNDRVFGLLLDWEPKLKYAAGKGFAVVNWGEDKRLHLLNFSGKKVARPFAVDLPSYPLTDKQVDDFLATIGKNIKLKGMARPEYWPAVQTIMMDFSDNIWVFGWRPRKNAPIPFVVYDRTGKKLGKGKTSELPKVVSPDGLVTMRETEEHNYLEKHLVTLNIN